MQYSVLINQTKALEWGLNPQQAMLFAFLYEAPSWADASEIDGVIYSFMSKHKVVEELPLLTDKPDTAYRLMRQLMDKGVIRLTSMGRRTLIAITEKGAEWNRERYQKKIRSAEENPREAGKKSDTGGGEQGAPTSEKNPRSERKKIRGAEENPGHVGNISEPMSEKSPTDHITSNQITKSESGAALERAPSPAVKTRGSRLPADWQPGPEYFSAAIEINPRLNNLQIVEIASGFRDHWIAQPGQRGVKLDWLATWRNWVRRERGLPPVPRAGSADSNQRTRDRSVGDILTDTNW